MNAVEIPELARRMLVDYDERMPGRGTCEPLELTIPEAYAVQSEIARLREQRGELIIGYKVGCTSPKIQKQLGVNEPIFGRLFAEECVPSGKRLSAASFANLAVEGELAVLLGDDLSGPSVTEEDCRAAIDSTFAVIELHHYVLPAAWRRIQWLIVSGGLHAGFIWTKADTPGYRIPRNLIVRVNDKVFGSVQDVTEIVSPLRSLCWLARRLADIGLRLHSGQVILTGSPLPLFPVSSGSHVVVEAQPLEPCCVDINP